MKVAFASPILLPRDGVGAYSRELCKELQELCTLEHVPLDAEVHEAAHFRKMAESVNRCDVLHVEHTHAFFKLSLYPLRDAFRDFLRRVRIPRLVVYHEPLEDIPVNYSPGDGSAGARVKGALRYAAMTAARPVAQALWVPRYNREIFSLPERVVVHTEYRAAMVRRFAPRANVRVVPHPVYVAAAERPEGRGAFPIPFGKDSIVVTVFGFIDRRKDYPGVLEALLRLPPRFKLLIAGGCHDDRERDSPSSPYGRMASFIEANGLEGRVHVTGFCPESAIPAIMDATDVVVAPFTQHHSSGSINMGLAYSRPVVAYRTMLTEEMNGNGAGLLLVDGKEQLARVLADAFDDPRIRGDAVARGAGYGSAYGFPMAARRFVEWYGEMLAPQ